MKLKKILVFALIMFFGMIFNVYADDKLESVTVEPNGKFLKVGSTLQFNYSTDPLLYDDEVAISWGVENDEIATIDENGLVTGVSSGTTSVTVVLTPEDGNVAINSATLRVYSASIDLETEQSAIYVGSSISARNGGTYNTNILTQDINTDIELTITDNINEGDNKIEGVIDNGQLSIVVPAGAKAGDYHVTLSANLTIPSEEDPDIDVIIDTATKEFDLAVSSYVDVTSISANDLYYAIGDEVVLDYTFNPTYVTNNSIVPVEYDEDFFDIVDGKVYTKVRGTKNITITSLDNSEISDEFTITVVDPKIETNSAVVSGNYDYDEEHIYNTFGGTILFDIIDFNDVDLKVYKDNELVSNSEITASFENDLLAIEISANALPGNYNLVINGGYSFGNDIVDSIEEINFPIEVLEYLAVSDIEAHDVTLTLTDTDVKLTYDFTPATPTNKDVTFVVLNPSVVTVDNDGTITPLKKGTTRVNVISSENNEIESEATITVINSSFATANKTVHGLYNFDNDKIYVGYGGSYVTAELIATDINDFETVIYDENQENVTDNFVVQYDMESSPFIITILTKDDTPIGDYTATIAGRYMLGDTRVGDEIENSITFSVENNILVEEIVAGDMLIKEDFNGKINYTITNNEEATNTNVIFENYVSDVLTIDEDGTIHPKTLDEGILAISTLVTISAADNSGVSKVITITVAKPMLTYEIKSIVGSYEEDVDNIFDYYPGTITVSYDDTLVDITEDSLIITESQGREIGDDEFSVTLDSDEKQFIIETNTKTGIGTYTISLVGEDEIVGTLSEGDSTFDVYGAHIITDISADDIEMMSTNNEGSQINYTLTHESAFDTGVSFEVIEGDDVISVNENGLVIPLSAGEGTVRIAAKVGPAYKDITVTVLNVDSEFVVDEFVGNYDFNTNIDTTTKIYEGHGGIIKGHLDASDATSYEIVVLDKDGTALSNENVDIENVDENLEFTVKILDTVIKGEYKLIVTAKYGTDFVSTDVYNFVVEENILITSISADDLFIANGETKFINYFIEPSVVTNDNLEFEIIDDENSLDIVSINEYGLVTGVSEGNTVIRIKATDGSNVTKDINVTVGTFDVDLAIYEIVGSYNVDKDKIYSKRGGEVILCETLRGISDVVPSYNIYDSADVNISNNLSVTRVEIDGLQRVVIKDENGYLTDGRYKVVATLTSDGITTSDIQYFDVEPDILVTNVIVPDTIYIKKGAEFKGFSYELVPDEVTNDGVHFGLKDGETSIAIDSDNLKILVNNDEELVNTSFDIVTDDGNVTQTVNVVFVESTVTAEITSLIGSYAIDDKVLFAGYGGAITGTIETRDVNKISGKLYDGDDNEVTNGFELAYNDDYSIFYLDILDSLESGDYTLKIIGSFYNGEELIDSIYDEVTFEVVDEVLVSDIVVDQGLLTDGFILDVDNDSTVLEFSVGPNNATNKKVNVSVSNDEIVVIDGDYKIYPLKVGETTITLTTDDKSDIEKVIPIKIVDAKINDVLLQVSGNNAELSGYLLNEVGGTLSGTYTVSDINGNFSVIISKGNEIVTESFGEININNEGFEIEVPATITEGNYNVTITGGYKVGNEVISSDTIDIPFVVYASDFVPEITAEDMRIALGEEKSVIYQPSSLAVTYEVDEESVLTISDTGVITPLKVGSTLVTITSVNDEEITATLTITVYDDVIKDTDYEIEGTYLTGVGLSVDVDDFVSELAKEGYEVSILDGDGNEKTTGKIGTGNKVVIMKNGVVIATYDVVVMMDTNGDGEADALDYVRIKNYIMNKVVLEGPYLKAANAFSNDEEINALDYVRVKNYIMNGGRA